MAGTPAADLGGNPHPLLLHIPDMGLLWPPDKIQGLRDTSVPPCVSPERALLSPRCPVSRPQGTAPGVSPRRKPLALLCSIHSKLGPRPPSAALKGTWLEVWPPGDPQCWPVTAEVALAWPLSPSSFPPPCTPFQRHPPAGIRCLTCAGIVYFAARLCSHKQRIICSFVGF